MNEYIFYTTEGITCSPKENQEIENCQLLGCATGYNIEDAKNNLLKDNPWISESGFDGEKIIVKQLLTKEIRCNIRTITEYLIQNKFSHTHHDTEDSMNNICHALYQLKDIIA